MTADLAGVQLPVTVQCRVPTCTMREPTGSILRRQSAMFAGLMVDFVFPYGIQGVPEGMDKTSGECSLC